MPFRRDDEEPGRRPTQYVHGNGNVTVGRDLNYGRAAPPPPGHPLAIECRQCRGITWRATQLCVHCDHDIGAWLAQIEAERQRLRRKARLRVLAGRFAMASAGLGLVAWLNVFSGLEQMFVTGLAIVFGLGAFKAWEACVNV